MVQCQNRYGMTTFWVHDSFLCNGTVWEHSPWDICYISCWVVWEMRHDSLQSPQNFCFMLVFCQCKFSHQIPMCCWYTFWFHVCVFSIMDEWCGWFLKVSWTKQSKCSLRLGPKEMTHWTCFLGLGHSSLMFLPWSMTLYSNFSHVGQSKCFHIYLAVCFCDISLYWCQPKFILFLW